MDKDLEIALELERIALSDDYFVSRKLYPNVDFYTGLIYRAMKFPTDFFTVLFAVARTAGLAGAVGGDAARQGAEDRAPAADLHGLRRAAVRVVARLSQEEVRKACVSGQAPIEWADFIVRDFSYRRFSARLACAGCRVRRR